MADKAIQMTRNWPPIVEERTKDEGLTICSVVALTGFAWETGRI